MNTATVRVPRVPRRAALSGTPATIGAPLDPRILALSDESLRHRWERIALGGRA